MSSALLPQGPATPLSELTTLGVGGPPAALLDVTSVEELRVAVAWAEARSLPVLVLGGGSNLVVADDGVEAAVLRMAVRGIDRHRDGEDVLLSVGAGEDWVALVDETVEDDLAGLECLAGIPGTVGATPIQNVGAYGREVAEVIEWVESLRLGDRQLVRRPVSECEFGYRTSRFKRESGTEVVTRVCFRLRRHGRAVVRYEELAKQLACRAGSARGGVREVRDAVMALRSAKGMVLGAPGISGMGTAGSFFMNPILDEQACDELVFRAVQRGRVSDGNAVPRYVWNDGFKVPAAWLIERAGFSRGHRHGQVGLSPHHALAVVTYPGATCHEVLRFSSRIRDGVGAVFGVALQPEPVFWASEETLRTEGGW